MISACAYTFDLIGPFTFGPMFSHKLKVPRRYIAAYKDKKLVEEVIDALKSFPPPKLKDISEESGIPYSIIQYWNAKLKKDQDYIPGELIGSHRRLFTEEQETNIAEMIKIQFIQFGVIIRRKHLRHILFEAWKSLDLENRQHHSGRKIMSSQFLKGFCRRNRLSFRAMRKNKRSTIDQREVDLYTQEICEVFRDYPKQRIANADETAWNYVFKRGEVLAMTGKEEVDARLPDDYKKSFTVISTITADGGKLPPVFLATGKTYRCHQQFEGMETDPQEYEIFHSPGGNTDEQTMIFYLKKFHQWMNSQPSALVVDRYPSHISETVFDTAQMLGIRLVLIPTSATSRIICKNPRIVRKNSQIPQPPW